MNKQQDSECSVKLCQQMKTGVIYFQISALNANAVKIYEIEDLIVVEILINQKIYEFQSVIQAWKRENNKRTQSLMSNLYHRKDGFITLNQHPSRPTTSHLKNCTSNSFLSVAKRPGTSTARTESTEESDYNFVKPDTMKDDQNTSNKKRTTNKFMKILDTKQVKDKVQPLDSFRSQTSMGNSPRSVNSKDSLFFSPRTIIPKDSQLKIEKSLKNCNKQIKFLEFMKSESREELNAPPLSTRNSDRIKNGKSMGFSTSRDNIFKDASSQQSTQESRRNFLRSVFKTQKEALTNYLLGQPVEKKIINSHQDLFNPLNFYKHLQKQKLAEKNLTNNSNNDDSESGPSTPIRMFKKQKKSEVGNGIIIKNSKAEYLNREDQIYFKKLTEIEQNASEQFATRSMIRKKFNYENIMKPNTQFIGKQADLSLPLKQSNLLDKIQILEQSRQESQKNVQLNIRNFIFQKQKEREYQKLASLNSMSQQSNQQTVSSLPIDNGQGQFMTENTQKQPFSLSKKLDKSHVNKFASLLQMAIIKAEGIDINNKAPTDSVTEEDEIIMQKIIPEVVIKQTYVDKILEKFIKDQEIEFGKSKSEIPFMALLNGIFSGFLSRNNILLEVIHLVESIGDPLTEQEREVFNLVKTNKLDFLKAKVIKNKSIVNRQDETGKTLLHWAAIRGHIEIVKFLVSMNSDLSLLDVRFKTAKCLAQEYKNFQILGILSQEMKYQQSIHKSSHSDRKEYIRSTTKTIS